MKTPAIVLSFLVFGICYVKSYTTQENNILADKPTGFSYNSLLEMVRKVIKEGYSDAGIPVLDPYRLKYAHVDFEDDIFRIIANITDGTFTGLGDFQMRRFDFSVDETMYLIDFEVYFPSLNLTSGFYEMEGSVIEIFPLAGAGVAHVEIYDFNIWSKLYLRLTDEDDNGGIMVDRFEDAGFTVSRIVSKSEYDNNFDDILNAMIEDLLADYLNRFSKYLAFTYSPFIADALNTALFNFSRTLYHF